MLKVFLFLICFSAFSQGVSFRGVNLPSYSLEGELESVIRCRTAIHDNGSVEMKQVELELFGDSKTLIKAPRCKYSSFRKQVTSKSHILLESEKMELSGTGFEYDFKTKELKIYKDVIIYLNSPEGDVK